MLSREELSEEVILNQNLGYSVRGSCVPPGGKCHRRGKACAKILG